MKQGVRVYSNGDWRIIELKDDEVPGWLEYNKKYRFGNALFLDGACQAHGYLSLEQVTDLELQIKNGALLKCQPKLIILPTKIAATAT